MKTLFLITAVAFFSAGLNATAADGSEIYKKECAKCHGADGKGDTTMGKKLKIKDLTAEVGKLSDAQIAASIKEGVKEGDKVRMKPIKALSDADVQEVTKFVKTLKK
jgi:mono/diheme cytochrome c family protein